MSQKKFSRVDLEELVNSTVGKTLGEVDSLNIFEKTEMYPKITGIAGDVIQQSVLGCPADNYQRADILVDGIETEVKTTGIRRPKKKSKHEFEAKEPMSVTAVSPKTIVEEDFFTSHFWNKIENLLLVYYEYASLSTVPAKEYANFPIRAYDFHNFSKSDIEVLQNDWTIVRDFIICIQEDYKHNPETQYPRLSSELRNKLMYIDTAPKWPNSPRFRLKRSTVTTMVQSAFGKKYTKLSTEINTLAELDKYLGNISRKYEGLTVEDILKEFSIKYTVTKDGNIDKAVNEQIIVNMIGSKSKKISDIDLFSKLGVIAKTVTQNKKGSHTEDSKFFTIDFKEFENEDIVFEESTFYNHFFEQQFLFAIFEQDENSKNPLKNKFIGFKRVLIPEEAIFSTVYDVWKIISSLIRNDELVESVVLLKNGEPRITPKTKVVMTSLNFPKSADYDIFVKGTGSDAKIGKTQTVNGIQMYIQNIWIKRSFLIDILSAVGYL